MARRTRILVALLVIAACLSGAILPAQSCAATLSYAKRKPPRVVPPRAVHYDGSHWGFA